MEFLEELPQDCPIDKANDIEVSPAYRVVSSLQPTVDDFLSNAALKKPKPPTVDDCRWASCSLFKNKDKAINIASKLPANKNGKRHISRCLIVSGVGRSYVNNKKHVDFWPYKNFHPSLIVEATEKI